MIQSKGWERERGRRRGRKGIRCKVEGGYRKNLIMEKKKKKIQIRNEIGRGRNTKTRMRVDGNKQRYYL